MQTWLNKILSLFLAVVLVIGSFSFVEPVKVQADSWDTGVDAGAGSISGTGSAGKFPKYRGSGWRIYLVPSGVESNGDISKGNNVFTEPKYYIKDKMVLNSITVTSLSESATGKIWTPYMDYSDVRMKVTTRVSKMSAVFKGISNKGLDLTPIEYQGDVNLSEDYWNNTFKDYIESNFAKAKKEFLNALGYDSTDTKGLCFFIEPVTFWEDGKTKALSWLNISDMRGKGLSTIFDLCMNRGDKLVAGSLNTVLTSDAPTHQIFRASSEIVPTGKVNGQDVPHVKVKDRDFLRNGYAIFGAGLDDGDSAKASTSFSLFYNGTVLESGKGLTVAGSGNISTNISGISTDTERFTLSDSNKNVILSSYGNELVEPFNTKSSTSLNSAVNKVTGYNKWSGVNDYNTVMTGVSEITFSNIEKSSTSSIYKALNEAMSRIKTFNVTSFRAKVFDSDINIGNTHSLKIDNITRNKLSEYVANILSTKSTIYKKSSAKRLFYTTDIGWTVPSSQVSANSSFYALAQAKSLKGVNTKKITPYKKSAKDKTEASTMGVSVSLFAKKKVATSYVAFATLDRSNKTIKYDGNNKSTYAITNNARFNIPTSYSNCVYVAIPSTSYAMKDDVTGSKIFNRLKNMEIVDEADLEEAVESMGYTVEDTGSAEGGNIIGVGSDSKGRGYSVLVLNLTGVVPQKSTLTLMDYELNYVFPSMLNKRTFDSLSGVTSYAKYKTQMIGVGCNKHITHLYDASNKVKVTTSSTYGGNIISINNKLGANKNILRNDSVFTGGRYFTTEADAHNKIVKDNVSNFTFSLAVNLTRSSFGDKRMVSTMSKQTIDKDFAQTNLGLGYGVKPSTSVVSAKKKRNSKSLIPTTRTDNFHWDTKFYFNEAHVKGEYTNKRNIYNGVYNVCTGHTHSAVTGGDPPAVITWTTYDSPTPYELVEMTNQGALSSGDSKVRYTVIEKAYKYDSDTIETAENKAGVVKDSLQASDSGLYYNKSIIINPYKIALVTTSDKTLGFYPEVTMRAYTTKGDTIYSDDASRDKTRDDMLTSSYSYSGVLPHNVVVMGEYRRTLKPSSMRTIKVNAGRGVVLEGKTISDAIAVGSNASDIAGNLPVIYAGGNISLSIKPNMSLSMYSYSLDLIEPSDNNLNGTSTPYTSVVADGTNVKSAWGNTGFKPLKEFNDWIKDTLDKLAVDTTLTVNGSGVNRVFKNFATSLGKLDSSSAEADGVFNIQIKQGKIVDNSGYNALITQIRSDYDLTTVSQAETLFKESDIYQTIADAVEDSSDAFNKSSKSNAIDGSRKHWYDEEVRTFVIRRYKKENIKIGNVLVNDKLDYGSAPTGDPYVTGNNSYKKATARWYMTLYFKDLPEGFGDEEVYEPYRPAGLSTANDAGTVLVNELYVNGADFVIPSASTHDMGNHW